ncbi:MAG TPA: GLUG motif-containing protein [Candidatus Nanopelagicales bacterium]|nr:GLUG motif-containing protein [Candidatus Nanopelagicales bacterium]
MPFLASSPAVPISRALVVTALGISALGVATLVPAAPAVAATCPSPDQPAGNQISTPENLQWLRDTSSAWSDTWTQTANIDMGGCEWTSTIGTSSTKFSGTYDGGGFVISGLTINMAGNDAGLFGVASSTSVIRNLGFTGDVSGANSVGGLVGTLDGGSIRNSYATGAVTGTVDGVGGLVGEMVGGSIVGSHATGDVQLGDLAGGGLVGYMSSGDGEVVDSFATGNVSGDSEIGGLIGYVLSNTVRVTRSFASGDVTATGVNSGGLIGFLIPSTCASPNGVSESFATGAVTSTNNQVGGLIGYNYKCDIYNSYAIGQVSGNQDVGGLVGLNSLDSDVVNSYAIGQASGNGDVGGLIGENSGGVSNSFWNTDTAATSDGGTGRTTAQLKLLSTFADAGWDITETCFASSIWGICSDVNSGYPYLSALSALTPAVSSQSREVDFTFFLPDGRECSSISPMRVPVGSSVQLPGVDADCRTMPGASVAGWTIPVAPGFTGAGSASEPFNPGHWVEVSDSQRFTVVPLEPVLSFTYDANIGEGVECAATDVPHASEDGREMSVWVPRADVARARFPVQASCVPDGHQLSGWSTRGDRSGDTYELGAELPDGWEQDPTNRRVLFAVWQAA